MSGQRYADQRDESWTVLLVDDDSSVLALVHRMLEQLGFVVLVASDGEAALGICRQYRHPIALLLTDMEMSGMSGFELAESVLQLRPQMAILFMSGTTPTSCRREGTIRNHAHLVKPFNAVTLMGALKQAVRSLAVDVSTDPIEASEKTKAAGAAT